MMESSLLELSSSTEFWIGVGSVVALYVVPKFFQLFQYPSVQEVQDRVNVPVPHRGDDNKLTIWGFNDPDTLPYSSMKDGIPDQSSFTGRVECFLRLHKITDYEKRATNMLSESPRNQVPVANVFGTMVDDSPRVIKPIREHYRLPQPKLTDQQEAMAHLITNTLTGSLAALLHHLMFQTVEGRQNFEKDMSASVPAPVRPLVFAQIYRQQDVKLRSEHVGSIPEHEIFERARKDLSAISTILGKNQYILGTNVATETDIDIYMWVGHIFYNHMYRNQPICIEFKKEYPSLLQHCDKLRRQLFPEQQFPKP